jgi:tetratricopeptide (TPR) repeat protein
MTLNAASALYCQAVECHQRRQLERAEQLYQGVLALQPGHAGALCNLGTMALHGGRLPAALELFERAVAADPGGAAAHAFLALCLEGLGRGAEALARLERSIASLPDVPELHHHRGVMLGRAGRFEEALASFERALAIRPDFAEALADRANALADLGRHEQALADYGRALELRPDFPEALDNRGATLAGLGRHAEALADFARAIALVPDFDSAHFDEAVTRLVTGDFTRGWEKFEWRWRDVALRARPRNFTQPLWDGSAAVAGKTILLHAEQGFGDTIQFCRYAPLVAARGADVILEVPAPLARLLGALPGVSRVIPGGQPLPAFDLHCPLLSLPRAFGTQLDSIPASPSAIAAEPALVERWRTKLGPGRGLRIGLAWSGRPAHANDRNRSIALARLLRALPEGLELISLQKDLRDGDAATLAADARIRRFEDDLVDFAETAGLVACLDLVVTVDTAVAHLAGALRRPVWVLLPFAPDWRWLLEREDSPWYPSARLFRQTAIGDWDGVLARVRAELSALALPRGTAAPPRAASGVMIDH